MKLKQRYVGLDVHKVYLPVAWFPRLRRRQLRHEAPDVMPFPACAAVPVRRPARDSSELKDQVAHNRAAGPGGGIRESIATIPFHQSGKLLQIHRRDHSGDLPAAARLCLRDNQEQQTAAQSTPAVVNRFWRTEEQAPEP